MLKLGYKASAEQFGPGELLRLACLCMLLREVFLAVADGTHRLMR